MITITISLMLVSAAVLANSDLLLVRTSLDQATKQILGKGDYRVLGAQTEIIDGREIHVIKVLTPDGRIQYFKVDAETGSIVG